MVYECLVGDHTTVTVVFDNLKGGGCLPAAALLFWETLSGCLMTKVLRWVITLFYSQVTFRSLADQKTGALRMLAVENNLQESLETDTHRGRISQSIA